MLGNVATIMQKEAVAALQQAMNGGEEKEIQQAWQQFHSSVVEAVRQDFEVANGDVNILAQRGFRQLTGDETKYYEKLIEVGKTTNPKQAMVGMTDTMPKTIIEDVFKELTEEHPLLSRINFQNVEYLTRWILNDHTKQTAVWGEVGSAITEEISSAFKVIEITQCKLSAFAMIEKDMLDLGPVFLDRYIREFLKEALLCALEKAILTGTGKNQPIGLDRDVSEDVTVTGGVYPQKKVVEVLDFLPETYGPLVARLAISEKGRMRKFDEVTMVCNQVDYLTKVMPATTVLNTMGVYSKDLFPFPTEVLRCNELTTGKALLFLPEEYFMGIGSQKEGVIEYSDDFKFLEDKRVFKIKMYGMGKAFDNTVAILLDISKLKAAYITVLQKDTTAPPVV